MNRRMKYPLLAGIMILSAPMGVHANDWMKGLGSLVEAVQPTQSPTTPKPVASSLSASDMTLGLKDALKVGSERVVQQLSLENGFNTDAKIHIPLPYGFERVKSSLSSMGMGGLADDLELKLNRAAEAATPKAKALFADAIQSMKIQDAQAILQGPNDAATQYFKGEMSLPLAKAMQPVIEHALNQVGAIQAYDMVMEKYKSLPFVPDVKANLNQHVVEGGMKGIFYYMAQEEAAIRTNPVKRTTDILKKVFAQP